jgi:DNA invertase Pin-like site-specific DNA recombinase
MGHDFRLCTGIDGRPERRSAGQAVARRRSRNRFPRDGERSQDQPRAITPRHRPSWQSDVLIVTHLDRLARSTRDLLNTLAQIAERGAGFKSLADTWADTTTAHGRLMLTVLGGLAEFERELIRARTSEGRARAKARGQSLGRPFKLTPHQRQEAVKRRDRDGETLAEIARTYNVSPATISRLSP